MYCGYNADDMEREVSSVDKLSVYNADDMERELSSVYNVQWL